jgi:hypothetical protein
MRFTLTRSIDGGDVSHAEITAMAEVSRIAGRPRRRVLAAHSTT